MFVNRYFEDQVISISFNNSNGESSVGVIAPGSYKFTTQENERLVVISGALMIQRDKDPEPILFSDGEEFYVPQAQTFRVEATESTAYLCKYG